MRQEFESVMFCLPAVHEASLRHDVFEGRATLSASPSRSALSSPEGEPFVHRVSGGDEPSSDICDRVYECSGKKAPGLIAKPSQ